MVGKKVLKQTPLKSKPPDKKNTKWVETLSPKFQLIKSVVQITEWDTKPPRRGALGIACLQNESRLISTKELGDPDCCWAHTLPGYAACWAPLWGHVSRKTLTRAEGPKVGKGPKPLSRMMENGEGRGGK
jgi:hypothetical protein